MKGILMLEILYHRTVSGHKTQTRRSGGLQEVNENPDDWEFVRLWDSHAKFWEKGRALNEIYCKARYKAGEIVFIKEPTFTYEDGSVLYAYDLSPEFRKNNPIKYANKLFMGADKARRYIQITDIKCERLLDISDEDCLKEGILRNKLFFDGWMDYGVKPPIRGLQTPQESFFSLFRKANKIKYDAPIENPWVFVYSYQFVDKPV